MHRTAENLAAIIRDAPTSLPQFPICKMGTEKYLLHRTICAATAAAMSCQSCPTLCDPIDGSLLGSAVPGIHQVRILEWVAISFSNA